MTKVRQAMVNQAIARIKQIYLPEDLRRRVLYDLNAQIANTTTRQFIQEVRQVVAKPALPIEQRQLLEEAYRLAFQEERRLPSDGDSTRGEVPPGDDQPLPGDYHG